MLDVGDQMTSFTYLSGSIVLLVKLNDITQPETMNVEAEAIHLLNSRNSRLVTFEYNIDSTKNVLERTSLLTDGSYFTAAANYQTVFPSVIDRTLEMIRETKFRSKRVEVRNIFFKVDFKSRTVHIVR